MAFSEWGTEEQVEWSQVDVTSEARNTSEDRHYEDLYRAEVLYRSNPTEVVSKAKYFEFLGTPLFSPPETYVSPQYGVPGVFDGRYKIIKQLTEVGGCFNHGIYIVQDAQTQEILLCKQLPKGTGSPEKNMLSRLNHPNITSYSNFAFTWVDRESKSYDSDCESSTSAVADPDDQQVEHVGRDPVSNDDGQLGKNEWEVLDADAWVSNLHEPWYVEGIAAEDDSSAWQPQDDESDFGSQSETDSEGYDRIYIEFCDRGTLENLIERYQKLELRVPEGFIWSAFMSLAKAVQHCHYGSPYNSPSQVDWPQDDWDPIVHRDIIPSNIFLSSTNQIDVCYPRVVLGDFGCGLTKSEIEEIVSKNDYSTVPAQDGVFADPRIERSLDMRSDIYQIGLNIWCLCYCQKRPATPLGDEDWEPVLDGERQVGLWPYSEDLRGVLNKCLTVAPEDRLTAEELVDLVTLTRQKLGKTVPNAVLIP